MVSHLYLLVVYLLAVCTTTVQSFSGSIGARVLRGPRGTANPAAFRSTSLNAVLTQLSVSAQFAPTKAPPKTGIKAPPKKVPLKVTPAQERINNVVKAFEDFVESDKYLILLYNDPFNKRAFVAAALMEVFSWSETMANDVMMQAHTNGYAVTGEYMQEVANEYCGELTQRGLLAEVVASADMKGGDGDGDSGGSAA